jgi:virulence-associated protein VapD
MRMSVGKLQSPRPARGVELDEFFPPERDSGRMYAIAFDLDTESLQRYYSPGNWRNAYDDIAREFRQHGFIRKQGSVYFGKRGTTSVNCVLAAQALCSRYSWFARAVRDIRMLRIEEENDLMPAIGQLGLFPSLPRAANG